MTRRGRIGSLGVAALLAAACVGNAPPAGTARPGGSVTAIATVPPSASPAPVASPTTTAGEAPSGRIAFRRAVNGESTAQAFLVNVDGSGEIQLTGADNEGGWVDHLVWAPDGSRLFFQETQQRPCGETYCYPSRVVSIRPDGSGRMDLGQIGAWGVGALSPDRRYVAYPAGEGYPDGAGTSFAIDAVVLDLLSGTMSSLDIPSSSIVWAPDSRRLLAAVAGRILVVDAHSQVTQLRIEDPWVQPDAPVGWSVDGESIFYRRCAPDLNKDEAMACMAGPSWVVNLSDPNLVPRPNPGAEPPQGALSPDASWYAAFLDAEAASGLYLTPRAGGEPRPVALLRLDGGTFEHPPSWSGDGAWLAIGTPSGISVVAAAGGEPLFVTLGEAPAWQPESR